MFYHQEIDNSFDAVLHNCNMNKEIHSKVDDSNKTKSPTKGFDLMNLEISPNATPPSQLPG